MFQPTLFPDYHPPRPPGPVLSVRQSARQLLRSLYALRKTHERNIFLPELNHLIDRLRAFTRASQTQIEESILYAIEVQMCWTFAELCEETQIERRALENLIEHLVAENKVRLVPRYIPGSGRQYFMIKSNRLQIGEMAGI